jgi:hypothetical protein
VTSKDVIISDIYSYVPVKLPFDAVPKTQFFLVRHVLIKYSSDYIVPPKKSSFLCLSDANYFHSCAKIFDKKWEDCDIDSCVDICLISGQPGPTDPGRNEILLCGRIYREDFVILLLTDLRNQDLVNNAFLLSYSTPQIGGVFDWEVLSHSVWLPHFFERMLMVRSTIARIIMSMENENKLIQISPRAIANQEKYNQIAKVTSQSCTDRTSSILDVMNKQVV